MRSLGPAMAFTLVTSLASLTAGCSTWRDDLARSQHAFEENRHEEALALLRMLERDSDHLDSSERARYAYLRGMTDFRIGYKADARHWLAVARAMDEKNPGLVPTDWRARLDASLAELDVQVFAGGMESLSTANAKLRATHTRRAPRNETPDDATEEEEQEQPKAAPKKNKPVDEDEDE